jgi:MOSC domain-containing protein YiiM
MIQGIVHSINVSDGGVPKLARASAEISVGGVEGDRQRDLRYHGGPERAVSLYSLELIRALQEEGHPIVEGSIGENLTLAGVVWERMRTGVRLHVAGVILELTKHAAPCKTIAGSFQRGEFERVSEKVHPGWSRLYARVIREGRVAVGDRVSDGLQRPSSVAPMSAAREP